MYPLTVVRMPKKPVFNKAIVVGNLHNYVSKKLLSEELLRVILVKKNGH